jgi:predicted esterase
MAKWLALLAIGALLVLLPGGPVLVRTASAAKPPAPSWCAPETEALPGDVCYVDANAAGRRTLVVFLHGLIPRNTTWQWTQHRAMARDAREYHFAAIMPQAPEVGPGGAGGYAWPGSSANPQAIVEPWTAARRYVEARDGRPFDEVFVLGFSSGAYFAMSLALRDQVEVDGYAAFAGGAPMQPAAEVHHRAPIFVGVTARDASTADTARALGRTLETLGWPHRVDEADIGHMFADAHVGRAVAYLRRMTDKARPPPP